MLQQLALETHAAAWAVASMLFFIAVFALVAYRAHRTPRSVHDAHARLPLDEEAAGDAAARRMRRATVDRTAARATFAQR